MIVEVCADSKLSSFNEFKWLEYRAHKDTAYCFVCYLFKDSGDASGDAFVDGGFRIGT
jgi:hypothetical protein